MSNWIVAANPKRYDVMGAFKDLKKVDWTQSATNIFVGDIVYIYVSAPEQAIRFKCKVNKVNLDCVEIEDFKYDFTGEFAKSNSKRMELEVLEEYETDALSKDSLSCVGFYPPQGPGHLKDEICEFIDMIEQIQKSDRDGALMLIGGSKWKNHFQARVDANMALRDKFVKDYPIERIPELTLEEFCVGFKSSKKNVDYNTFCYRIEFELSNLGSMKGASSQKFGVFYSPKYESYEYVSRFGNDADTAFTAVKREICALLEAGKAVDIEAIEKCDLANIFKLKLLSTYYPDCYPSIFEESIYDHFLNYLNVDMNSPRYSNLLGIDSNSSPGIVRKGQLLKHWKDGHPITCDWSNQLFTDIMGIVVAGWRNTPDGLVDPVTPGGYVPAGNKTLGVSAHNRQHWVFAPGENAYKWKSFYENGIMALGWNMLGNLKNYESKSDIIKALKEQVDSSRSYKNAGHALWQFVHQMKVGDVIYVKRGRSELIGRGIITSEYEYDEHAADEFVHIRKVNWIDVGQWPYPGVAPTKALTD